MVVGLDVECDHVPVADVDHPGVVTGAENDALPLGREELQKGLRGLVTAVLGPLRVDDAPLDFVRLPAEGLADDGYLVLCEAEPQALQAQAPAPPRSERKISLPSSEDEGL
jgi:hypothetical protein